MFRSRQPEFPASIAPFMDLPTRVTFSSSVGAIEVTEAADQAYGFMPLKTSDQSAQELDPDFDAETPDTRDMGYRYVVKIVAPEEVPEDKQKEGILIETGFHERVSYCILGVDQDRESINSDACQAMVIDLRRRFDTGDMSDDALLSKYAEAHNTTLEAILQPMVQGGVVRGFAQAMEEEFSPDVAEMMLQDAGRSYLGRRKILYSTATLGAGATLGFNQLLPHPDSIFFGLAGLAGIGMALGGLHREETAYIQQESERREEIVKLGFKLGGVAVQHLAHVYLPPDQ